MSFLSNSFKRNDPVRKVANARQQNRLANILMDLRGVGCRIEKPENADGLGWRIVVDGSTDDPAGPNPDYKPPVTVDTSDGYQYQVLQLDADLQVIVDWVRAHA